MTPEELREERKWTEQIFASHPVWGLREEEKKKGKKKKKSRDKSVDQIERNIRDIAQKLKEPLKADFKELPFETQLEIEAEARDYLKRLEAAKNGEAVDLRGPALRRYIDYPADDGSGETISRLSQDGSPLGDEDDAVGDLAEELGNAFHIIDRIVWFLKELDIEAVTLPDEIEKESLLLFRQAKDFVDRMEYGSPLVIQAALDKEEIEK